MNFAVVGVRGRWQTCTHLGTCVHAQTRAHTHKTQVHKKSKHTHTNTSAFGSSMMARAERRARTVLLVWEKKKTTRGDLLIGAYSRARARTHKTGRCAHAAHTHMGARAGVRASSSPPRRVWGGWGRVKGHMRGRKARGSMHGAGGCAQNMPCCAETHTRPAAAHVRQRARRGGVKCDKKRGASLSVCEWEGARAVRAVRRAEKSSGIRGGRRTTSSNGGHAPRTPKGGCAAACGVLARRSMWCVARGGVARRQKTKALGFFWKKGVRRALQPAPVARNKQHAARTRVF